MGADFLFVAQLLVYTGGILILLLFVVLLSGSPAEWAAKAVNAQWAASALVAGVLMALLVVLMRMLPTAPAGLPPALPTTATLGFLLMKDMLVPFEAVSLVLLATLVGAVHFSKKEDAAS
jgi:NADH-quinone oxidoreductase subunit J